MRKSGKRGKIWFGGDEEERGKKEEKVLGEMRKSGKRRKIRFGGDEEEREKREEKVWG
ncbi:hypothetical protein [Photobacterium damselae]|uniref:hypothetical protein n=1 Tax=Photobacterium damselae TaxID=38293 RepID=UPI001EFD151A|nr:hypothetical protein [Photobacterium damselae]MCG9706156.1 hypothetical protein [Photobacterium damselae]